MAIWVGIVSSVMVVAGILPAVVDAALHPEINFFDPEHLVVGGVLAIVVGAMLGVLVGYAEWQRGAHTAIQKAELLLRESEMRFRSMADASPALLWMSGTDKLCTYFNKTWLDFTGRSLQQEMGEGWTDGVHPEDLQRCLDTYVAAFDERRDFSMEYRLRRANGEYGWILDQGVPRFSHDGAFAGYMGSCTDITERKRAEQELHKLSIAVEQSPVSIVITDARGDIEYINPKFTAITGYTLDDVRGQNPRVLKSGDTHPDEYRELWKTISTGNEWRGEFHNKRKNGEHYWEVASISPIKTADNVISHYVAVKEDVTGLKLIEGARRDSERRFRMLFDNVPIGLYRTTPDGRIILANPALLRLLGCKTFDELAGLHLTDAGFAPGSNRQIFLQQMRTGGEIRGLESVWTRKDGATIHVRESARAARDGDGNALYYDGMVEDITEQKHVEQALRESEENLRQFQKMEAIGQLAGGIAHDFNNILAGIIGYVDLSLPHAEKGSTLEKNLHYVMAASDRAKRLVEQILVFSRKGSAKKSVVAIQPLILEAMELLKATIPSSVLIKADVRDDAKRVLADPTQIHEALINLATNAVHAMERRGILRIRLFTQLVEKSMQGKIGVLQPGEYSVIEVEDNGTGMDPRTLSRAFEPFFTTKAVGEGTGMGLSVVVGVVQGHCGDIRVKSEEGKGTTVTLYLPVTEEPMPGPLPPASSDRGGGTEHILLVDDELLLVEMMRTLLEKLGYRVTGTTSATEALSLLRGPANDFDILVTDQTMPGMTGIELAKAALKERPDLPVILCTGYSLDVNQARLEKIGISKLIMKPFRPQEIGWEIRAALDGDERKK
jgi:PAS domain S-box-containing protein